MYDESKKVKGEKEPTRDVKGRREPARDIKGRKKTLKEEISRNDGGKEDIEAARKQMLLRLEQMSRSGVKLFVDGQAVLPREAVLKAVRENSPYMADYVLGASGKIEQVRFDKVTRC